MPSPGGRSCCCRGSTPSSYSARLFTLLGRCPSSRRDPSSHHGHKVTAAHPAVTVKVQLIEHLFRWGGGRSTIIAKDPGIGRDQSRLKHSLGLAQARPINGAVGADLLRQLPRQCNVHAPKPPGITRLKVIQHPPHPQLGRIPSARRWQKRHARHPG